MLMILDTPTWTYHKVFEKMPKKCWKNYFPLFWFLIEKPNAPPCVPLPERLMGGIHGGRLI